jgi:hypothetical protein
MYLELLISAALISHKNFLPSLQSSFHSKLVEIKVQSTTISLPMQLIHALYNPGVSFQSIDLYLLYYDMPFDIVMHLGGATR